MRKYISLVPALIVIHYSLVSLREGDLLSVLTSVIITCAVSLSGLFYLLKYFALTTAQKSKYTLTGISIGLIPFEPAIFRAVLAFNVIAVFALIAAKQSALVPLFLCWLGWQYLVRRLIFSCAIQKAA